MGEPYYGYGEPYYGYGEPIYGYGEHEPHMGAAGYGAFEPVGYYAGEGGYGEPHHDMAGYVRAGRPTFNAGCPMPTNVSGFGEPHHPLEGYVKPREVSPSCEGFKPQPGPTPSVPDTFKPLW